MNHNLLSSDPDREIITKKFRYRKYLAFTLKIFWSVIYPLIIFILRIFTDYELFFSTENIKKLSSVLEGFYGMAWIILNLITHEIDQPEDDIIFKKSVKKENGMNWFKKLVFICAGKIIYYSKKDKEFLYDYFKKQLYISHGAYSENPSKNNLIEFKKNFCKGTNEQKKIFVEKDIQICTVHLRRNKKILEFFIKQNYKFSSDLVRLIMNNRNPDLELILLILNNIGEIVEKIIPKEINTFMETLERDPNNFQLVKNKLIELNISDDFEN